MPYTGVDENPCYRRGGFFPTGWCQHLNGIALTSYLNCAACSGAALFALLIQAVDHRTPRITYRPADRSCVQRTSEK
jgi:hypothetical protein